LTITILLDYGNLRYNYYDKKKSSSASNESIGRSSNIRKKSNKERISNLSNGSNNDSYESDNEEEYQKRMLDYLKAEQDYFFETSNNILMKTVGLTKKYAKKEVVNLTLGIESGICLGMIGPNGAGKTTTINLLLSFIKKSGGEIQINKKIRRKTILESSLAPNYQESENQPLQTPKAIPEFWREKCGICFQDESLWNELTIEQHIEFMIKLFNIEDYSKVINLLKYFEIHHLLQREVYKLSTGERKKLLVVLNLINKSNYYFFDETSANLDPDSREDLRKILNKLKIGYKATIVTTTHFVKGKF
jgi:ABC-2 type transport system ATP-binding protein